VCSEGQASALSSLDVDDEATALQQDIAGVSRTTSQLTVSFYALLAWVVLVTAALLTVVAVRWRRQRRRADPDWEDASVGGRSTSDAASVCSRPTSDTAAASAVAVRRDRTALEGVEIASRQSSVDDALPGVEP